MSCIDLLNIYASYVQIYGRVTETHLRIKLGQNCLEALVLLFLYIDVYKKAKSYVLEGID